MNTKIAFKLTEHISSSCLQTVLMLQLILQLEH